MSEKADSKSMWEFIQNLPAVISSIAAASLLFSVAYELGFLFAIDMRLVGLFSIQDAITGALSFLPFAAFGAVFAICEGELNPRGRGLLPRSHKFDAFLLFAGATLIIFSTDRFFGLLMISLLTMRTINLDIARREYRLITFVMILVAATFAWGGHTATQHIHDEKTPFQIDGVPFQILTSGADILVVRDKPGHILILSRSEVKKIERTIPEPEPWISLPQTVRWIWEHLPLRN